MKQYTGVSERGAGLFLIGNLIAFGIGRIVSTQLMRWVRPTRMMGTYAVINIALLAVGILHPGLTGAYAILLTSYFMSIMFPTIFALGVKGLGEHTKLGGSVIVMSIVGGAVMPCGKTDRQRGAGLHRCGSGLRGGRSVRLPEPAYLERRSLGTAHRLVTDAVWPEAQVMLRTGASMASSSARRSSGTSRLSARRFSVTCAGDDMPISVDETNGC